MIYLQVNAVASDTAAKKQAAELQKAGFTSVIMGGGGANSLYKVQVGPFATNADADTAKRKLEALGYKPIRK
jgi:cell division protein FtsN